MKPLTTFFIPLFALCYLGCNAQDKEHYVKGNFDCYIAIAKDTVHQFTPTHAEVDRIESALLVEEAKDTNSEFYKKVHSDNMWIKYYRGFIDEKKRRTIDIYADFRPNENGVQISDGQWAIDFDLNTGTFSNFRIIGG
jgi:hypothetical protein